MEIDLNKWDIQAKILQVKLSGRIFLAKDDGELYEIVPNIPASHYMEQPPDSDDLPDGMLFMFPPSPQPVLVVTVRNILTNQRRRVDVTQIKLWDTLNPDATAQPAKTEVEAIKFALTWYSRHGTRGEKIKANRRLRATKRITKNWINPRRSGIIRMGQDPPIILPPNFKDLFKEDPDDDTE